MIKDGVWKIWKLAPLLIKHSSSFKTPSIDKLFHDQYKMALLFIFLKMSAAPTVRPNLLSHIRDRKADIDDHKTDDDCVGNMKQVNLVDPLLVETQ